MATYKLIAIQLSCLTLSACLRELDLFLMNEGFDLMDLNLGIFFLHLFVLFIMFCPFCLTSRCRLHLAYPLSALSLCR